MLFVPCILFASEIEIKADSIEYDEESKFLVAEGSVAVTWADSVLKADKVKFWVEKKYLSAENNVSITEGESVLFGDNINYDYKNGTGEVNNVAGYSVPWYFYTKKAVRQSEKLYSTERLTITTCDLKKPHYTIRARKAKIILEKRITIYSPVFYVRDVPVFYLPIYSQAMGPHRDSLEVQPGYNSEDGLILKVKYGYPLSANTYGKLYVDFFSRKGWGKGAELNYNVPDRIKGTIYGYHIKEETTQNERWTLRASHWQKLDNLWTSQAEMDFVSDTSFNNVYFRENWQRINQRIHSYAAFTRQSSKSNLRIISERYDTYDSLKGGFEPESITLPRVTYTLFPTKGKLPFYTNFNLSLQNQYTSAYKEYIISGNADTTVSKDYRLTGKLTLRPQIGISETWQNKSPLLDMSNIFQTQYFSSVNLRWRLSRRIDWDLSHNYRLRSETNSLLIDESADDYGEVSNLVSFQNSMYLSSRMTLRNSTSYNLHKNRSENILDWRNKFNPLVNELTWIPSNSYYVYLREESIIHPHSIRAVQADSRIGNPDKKYLNFGVFYQSDRPDQLDFNTGIGFCPTQNWKIDYNIRTTTLDSFGQIRANDQELKLYRDLHCWEFKLSYRRRLNAEEIYFQLDLKSASKNRKNLYPAKQEQEFYPWR